MSDGVMDGMKKMAGMMSGDMHTKMEAMTADMKSDLESMEGNDFDKMFLEMMIMHHEQAIDMSKIAQDKAEHDQIREISSKMIEDQKEEISQMKQWLRDWSL